MQLPLWEPESDWQPPKLSELPEWSQAKRIAVDIETCDPHLVELGPGVRRNDSYMVGMSFAIEDGPAHYLPMRHESSENNLDEKKVLRYLKAQVKKFKGDYVGANMNYDLDYLMEEGLKFNIKSRFLDIQIADPLINELQTSYSLDNIAKRYGLPGKDTDKLVEAAKAYSVSTMGGLWKLPARFVGPYATADVVQPLLVLRKQERKIDDQDLWNIWNLETDVLPVLVKMRRRGVKIDLDRLGKIEEWTLKEEHKALALVKQKTGVSISVNDVWKSKALAPALQKIGVTLPRTSTGAASVDKDVLGQIKHPVAKAIAWSRKVNKLRTTFAASIRKFQVKGRIHTTFNQIISHGDGKNSARGARYGRLSGEKPNLQQQPNPEKEDSLPILERVATDWRKIYLPEEGMQWACCDYSQQEPRWTTHFASLMKYPKAQEAAQAYHDDPNIDNHQFMADITGVPRPHAKLIFLGLCYGEGGAKLCRSLDLPTRWALARGLGRQRTVEYFEDPGLLEKYKNSVVDKEVIGFQWEAAGVEGQKILDQFDSYAPYVKKLAGGVKERAGQRGYIITVGGRHLHFPQKSNGSYDWLHKSLNRLIQGTSADQMKKALVEIDKAGHHLMLQVHDDASSSVRDRKEAQAIAEIMRNVMPARVPFKVDVEVGPSWGEAAKEAV